MKRFVVATPNGVSAFVVSVRPGEMNKILGVFCGCLTQIVVGLFR